jgi:hypothetical protein
VLTSQVDAWTKGPSSPVAPVVTLTVQYCSLLLVVDGVIFVKEEIVYAVVQHRMLFVCTSSANKMIRDY